MMSNAFLRRPQRRCGSLRERPLRSRIVSVFCRPGTQLLESRRMMAVTIAIDYSYDSHQFFDTQAKKDLLQLAADSIAKNFNDNLAAIVPTGRNSWSASF